MTSTLPEQPASEAPAYGVVGAGMGGSLMAILLARQGHTVSLFEGRDDPRRKGIAAGRSINLALSRRGLDALAQADLKETILKLAVPMRGRMIHSQNGRTAFQPYSAGCRHAIQSVSRGGLNLALLQAAEEAGVRLHFQMKCKDVNPQEGVIHLDDLKRGAPCAVRVEAIIGADGAYSAVRRRLQRSDGFDFQQAYLAHGYKELTLPAVVGGGFAMEPHALHIWPRGESMMIALPNHDGSFTCTLFWPRQGPAGFAALATGAQVRSFFERTFPDAVALLPDLEEEYFSRAEGSLVTIRCRPWHQGPRVVLLGDACHAVVPFYGQGANAAFEDCLVLAEALSLHPNDRERAFTLYEAGRVAHAWTLADLSLANFIEMRDRTASRWFLARKLLERSLHRLFPTSFIPLYSLVTFSRLPYGEAVRRSRRQWETVLSLVSGVVILVLMLLILALGKTT